MFSAPLLSTFILVTLLANGQNVHDEDNVSNGPWMPTVSGITHLQPYALLFPASEPFNFCFLQMRESFSGFIHGRLGPDPSVLVLFLLNVSSQSQ